MIGRDTGHDETGLGPRQWRMLYEVDLAPLVTQYAAIRQLCDDLEMCADHLPDRRAILSATAVSAALVGIFRTDKFDEFADRHHVFGTDNSTLASLLGRTCRGRNACTLLAEDLHDALATASESVVPVQTDAISYMMRCLFDSSRHSTEFQLVAVLIAAEQRLTTAARKTLIASLTPA